MSVASDDSPQGRVTALRRALQARAAGFWRLAGGGDRLEQVAFDAAPEVAEDQARAFAEATRSVALATDDLGVVRAVRSGEATVSRVEELPAETGSGRWLRAFGAERSVAVPLRDSRGTIRAVASVAMGPGLLPESVIEERVRAAVLGLIATL